MTDVPPPPPPFAAGPDRPLAGFWIRFGGQFLHSILYGSLQVPFMVVGTVLFVQASDDCATFDDEIICPPGAPDGGPIALGALALSSAWPS